MVNFLEVLYAVTLLCFIGAIVTALDGRAQYARALFTATVAGAAAAALLYFYLTPAS